MPNEARRLDVSELQSEDLPISSTQRSPCVEHTVLEKQDSFQKLALSFGDKLLLQFVKK
jgi:hypothetical protein